MVDWNLKYYLGREIKTEEDIMWVCEQITNRYKSGTVNLEDMAALSYLKELHQEYIDQGRLGTIGSRFEILDL